MLGRGGAGCVVRARQRGGLAECRSETLDVEWVGEDPGAGWNELGRPADPRRDDRAPARHPLEQRLAERLDQARLAEDVALGEQARDLVVRHAAEEADVCAAFEARAQRPVAR